MPGTKSTTEVPGHDRPCPGLRTKVRKGTRSCIECRRRKIRCVFSLGSSVCSRCSTRGCDCVDQTGRNNRTGAGKTDNLSDSSHYDAPFEREPEWKQLGEPPLSAPQKAHAIQDYSADLQVVADVNRPPPLPNFLSGDQKVPSKDAAASLSEATKSPANLCEVIRSCLPDYDSILAELMANCDWWNSFQQKMGAISQTSHNESLLEFAARAFTSTNPALVAILAVAYARTKGQNRHILPVVDRLLLSDFALVATLDGMECLVLLAKTYTDIGQPRRAWLTWRRGLAVGQLMGLHCIDHIGAGKRKRLWSAVYHGDRFTSLLLGLPHGSNDTNLCDGLSKEPVPTLMEAWVPWFVDQCAILAGQVIDYISPHAKPSFARAMTLDEKMDDLYNSAPAGWWDVPPKPTSQREQCSLLLEFLLIQFFFFHVRMYLHLPLLKTCTPPSSSGVNRLACTAAARQMLRLYLVLRAKVNGRYVFDCKTSDFISLTAAVTLLIGSDGLKANSGGNESEDTSLIEETLQTFKSLEEDSCCQVAAQCRRTLSLLINPPQDGSLNDTITIPYLGTVVRGRQVNSDTQVEPANHHSASLLQNGTEASALDTQHTWEIGQTSPSKDYREQGIMLGEENDQAWIFEAGLLPQFELYTGNIDIDHDWSLFAASFGTPASEFPWP